VKPLLGVLTTLVSGVQTPKNPKRTETVIAWRERFQA
jgi:hypothetical protein